MPEIRKVPYTEDRVLYETTVGALNLTPIAIAQRLNLEVDTGCDNLDYFDILILDFRGKTVGFLRHRGAPENFCGVSNFSNLPIDELEQLLFELLPSGEVQFTRYDEPW
ncbi:hypothetical protein [Hyphobacterium sp.]|uniref:hypothetical protein n=1 Tax=Hyphobacterium sp. TaxID=2004662 RepID=UPI003BA88640